MLKRTHHLMTMGLILLIAEAACWMASDSAAPLKLRHRLRVEEGQGSFRLVEADVPWNPTKTAIVIVDMWDNHHCRCASMN